jgi:iron complex outermembrane receptor protein
MTITRPVTGFAALSAAVVMSLICATPAGAQATAKPAAGGLEEIVVTAQKREEKLQDVPIAISAFSSEQLEARGISSVGSLNALAPNLQISTATGNTTGSQFSIRGAVTINPALYWDPTVGVYLDGVYVSKALGGIFDLIDLERVEVLRGPQGTLYGRNTLAGAVNLVTRQPTGKLGGSADVTFGNYNDIIAKGSLDLPKFGIASLSLGARIESRDGMTRTTAGSSADELDNRDQKGGRVALNLDFTSAFQAAYRFDFTDVGQKPLNSYLYRVDAPISFFPFVPGVTPIGSYLTKKYDTTVSIDGPTFERSHVRGHGLTLRWDLSEHMQLKSITAYRKLQWDDALDLDGSPLPLAHTQRYSDYNNKSEELQLVGSADRINYVAGIYYFKDDGNTYNPQAFFGGTFNFDSRYGYNTEAWAGYGQVEYQATDAWTLTGGLRYTSEKKGITRSLGVNFAPGTPFIPLVPAGTTASKTFTAVTPLLTLAYKFSPNVNGYLKYSEGFKSGGFNGEYGDVADANGVASPTVIAGNIAETQRPFNPEKDRTIELGLKSTLYDGHLTLNGDVFYNKVKDQQISVFRATGAASSVIRNAGKATVYGAELDATLMPIDALRFQFNYGYLHSKYDEFIDAGVDVASNRAFVHAPENTFNVVAEGRLFAASFGTAYLGADYSWTDEFYDYPYPLAANYPGDPGAVVVAGVAPPSFAGDTQIKAVGFLNARLSLRDMPFGGGKGEIALFARNLGDEQHVANNIDFGPGFGHLTPAYYAERRTYGIELKARF